MALLYKGEDISGPLLVHDWHETGLAFTPSKWGRTRFRRHPLNLFVYHWTGGEPSAEKLFAVLKNRNLSVNLFIDNEGQIFQFADLHVVTSHAGNVNNRSAGCEISNRGLPPKASAPYKGMRQRPARWGKSKREVYEGEIRRRKLKMTRFYPAQIQAAVELSNQLAKHIPSIPRATPKNEDGTLLTGTPNHIRQSFKGFCGHYQVSKNKIDPGNDLLQAHIDEGY